MGIFWPILRVARWPSVARMLGFCRMRVSASVSSALTVRGGDADGEVVGVEMGE